MAQQPFILNQIYKRSSIHDQYGGNRQSGISYPKDYPYIFIFSSKAGHQHGYKDQWENNDIYSYTGQGQDGDMKFEAGNLELKDHISTGKRVFLFTESYRSHFMFEGEVEYDDFGYETGLDTKGKERIIIKFFFKRVGVNLPYSHREKEISLVNDHNFQLNSDSINATERKGLITSRVGQGAYRKSILYRWEFKCAVTGYTKDNILIASHIVPWRDSTNKERLDVNNGILLSPTYDALFDQHLISFQNTGKIILSDSLLSSNYKLLGVSGTEKIQNLSKGNIDYLERHRILLEN